MLALGPIVPVEAVADAITVVAVTSPRAVSSGLVTIPLQNIWTRRTLKQRTIRASASEIAHAAYLLVGIPGSRVGTAGLGCELLLCVAHACVGTPVG
jgi:hypothetical protein